MAQINKNADYKTHKVKIKADRFVFYNEEVFYTHSDTIVYFADTVDFYVKRNSMDRTESFYDSLEKNMRKGKVSQALYESVFLTQDTLKNKPNFDSHFKFLPFENKKIKDVKVKQIDIFGTNIEDTTEYHAEKFGRFLNKIHVNTWPRIIKKNLLFDPGDPIDANQLLDSERLLRSLDFIQDARILVDTLDDNTANIHVVTKDLLPWIIELGPTQYEHSLLSIGYNNIAGFGHEFEYVMIQENDLGLLPGSDFYYRIPSILGSYTLLELNYSSLFSAQGFGFRFDREFVTQEIKYAGGVQAGNYGRGVIDYYDFESDTAYAQYYSERIQSAWLGRAFQTNMRIGALGFKKRTNIVISSSYDNRNFYDKPFVSADSNYRFHNYQNILVGFGVNSRKFYTDNFVLKFGRTEDIPTGGSLGTVVGYQIGEFKNRPYVGFNYARGGYLRKFGYLNVFSEFGGYIPMNNSSQLYEDAVINIGLDYFSKLFILNQSKYRQFIGVTWKRMINPREAAYLSTENEIGIRGLRRFALQATDQIGLRWESLVFTPVDIGGFRMACFAYVDITTVKNTFESNKWNRYSGIGIGFQFKNDETSLNTILVRLSYFPNSPDGAKLTNLGVHSSSPLKIRDFNFSAPSVATF